MQKTFMCVNKLVADKTVMLVFFASDSLYQRQLARKLMADKNALFEVANARDLVSSTKHFMGDTFEIRDKKGMEFAATEWQLIGDADFCMSPTIESSTFSKTAIARGKCRYVDHHAIDHCDVWKDSAPDKDIFLKTLTDDLQ